MTKGLNMKLNLKTTRYKQIEEPKYFNEDLFFKTWCNAGPVILLTDGVDLATVFTVYEPSMAYILRQFLQTQKATLKFIGLGDENKPSCDEYCKRVAVPLAYALLYPEKPFSKRVLAIRDMCVHRQQDGSWTIDYCLQRRICNEK